MTTPESKGYQAPASSPLFALFIGIFLLFSICIITVSVQQLSPAGDSSPIATKHEPSAARHSVTVVSQYFPLERSKHSIGAYRSWLDTMLQSVTSLVIFTDETTAELMRSARAKPGLITSIYVYETIWDVLGEMERERNRSYVADYRQWQNGIDPEKDRHVPELYALWNLKSFMMTKAIRANAHKSSFFVYSDAGAWRTQVIHRWPDVEFVAELAKVLGDRIMLGQTGSGFDPNDYNARSSFIQGTFFAGSARAVELFAERFYALHDELLGAGEFVGKDQTQMKTVGFDMYKNETVRLKNWIDDANRDCGFNIDRWFFYQLYMAKDIGGRFNCSREYRLKNFLLTS